MATELGQAYVQIMPSAKGIGGMIQKEMGPGMASAGSAAGSKLVSMIKGAITAAAIGKFVGSALTQGRELQQSLGGVETMFKDHADTIKNYASEAYKTVGVSANEYMQSVTSFSAALIKANNGRLDWSAEDANMAMIDMADNANKMGSSMESIKNAYQGFAKQNYTMLDNLKLGYGGTKEEMERLLEDAGKISGMDYDISNLSDVFRAINVIQGELGITGTTAKEASETLQGSLASMKASFNNVLGGLSLGQDITTHLQALAQTTATFLFKNLLPMLGNIIAGLPTALATFVQAAIPYLLEAGSSIINQISTGMATGSFSFLSNFTTMILNAMNTITANLPMFLEQGVELISNLVSGVLQGMPQFITASGEIIIGFINFLLANIPTILVAGKDLLLALVSGIVENLPAIADSTIQVIGKFLDTIIQNYPQYIKSGIGIIAGLAGGIIKNIPKIVATAGEIIIKFIGMIVSKLPSILASGAEILKNIVLGIGSVASELYGKAGELMGGLMDKVKEWKDRFFDAGKNIVTSIAEGIMGAIGTVTDAIGNVVQKIRDHLPFSPAKEGPLRDLNKLDFTIIADGIYDAKKPITDAMRSLAQSTIDGYDAIANIKGNVSYSVADGQGLAIADRERASDRGMVINIANVNNSNERDIQNFAEELEFYRKRKEGLS